MPIRAKKAFTLVELMAAIIISAVLALTAGLIVYYGFMTWHRDNSAVELQRDAAIAIDMMSRAIRPSNSTKISVENSGAELIVSKQRFYQQEYSLFYDPDKDLDDNEVVIIDGKLPAGGVIFTKQSASSSINIDLNLESDNATTHIVSNIGYRC